MATYYIDSVNGVNSLTNNGSESQPWKSIQWVLSSSGGKASNNTLIVKPGVYDSFTLVWGNNGTAESQTIIRSEIKWAARILGSALTYVVGSNSYAFSGHGIYIAGDCEYMVIDGFEITGASIDGVKTGSDRITVRNCWVHHNTGQGISLQGSNGSIIDSNLVEFNGIHPQFDHGVYAYGDGMVVKNNIVRNNAGMGLQLYPAFKNSLVEHNLTYNHKFKAGMIISGNGTPSTGNICVNNIFANNRTGLSYSADQDGVVANNIFYNNTTNTSESETPIYLNYRSIKTNNLEYGTGTLSFISPTTTVYVGTNTIYGDPLFVDPAKGVYWLSTTSSPALGVGATTYPVPTVSYLPTALDFWGATYTGTSYIGAFPYVASLADSNYRATWNGGYAYNYMPSGIPQVPDFWTI